jgi:hypothetical protein
MKEFEFILKFSLPKPSANADDFIDRLAEAGCEDALIGIGQSGRIALDFCRSAANAIEAVTSAIQDVKKAIPDAKLIEAGPDLVGISDIADLLGFTRQNMRKLMLKHSVNFPAPIHEGKSAIWHLAKVLNWFEQGERKTIEPTLKEVAYANMQLNIVKENSNLDPQLERKLSSVLF